MNLVKLENITKILKSQVANGEVKGASYTSTFAAQLPDNVFAVYIINFPRVLREIPVQKDLQ